jgi:DNA-binding transcriptional LysR family regulator
MEIRVLEYFLAVAQEESITRAAEALHLSQPTLSRQLKDLEDDLGKTLLIRGNKKTTLTEEGKLLRRRAREIVDLTRKAEAELRHPDTLVGGDIWIGGGETEGMRVIAQVVKDLQTEHPDVHVHFFSGNTEEVTERLEKGLIDFGVGVASVEGKQFDRLRLNIEHEAGILMRKDSALATRRVITPQDLAGQPVIVPRNEGVRRFYAQWMGDYFHTMRAVATFNLIYNAAFLVEVGVGYALTINNILDFSETRPLCFVPNDPPMSFHIDVAWKKNQIFTKASMKFLERLHAVTYAK